MARAWSRPATQLKEKWSRVTTETKSPRSSLSPGAHSGQLVGKLRELITDIKASQPVVVGIDEIDRIGSVEQGAVYQ